MTDPYDQGRIGGYAPPSGPDFAEWHRGNQDRLKGLQQPTSGFVNIGGGDDSFAPTFAPPPQVSFGAGPVSSGPAIDWSVDWGGASAPTRPARRRWPVALLVIAALSVPNGPPPAVVLPTVWACLYPLAAAASAATWMIATRLVPLLPPRVDPRETQAIAAALPLIAAFVALLIATKIDRRLASNAPYRIARHVLRVLLSAAAAAFLAATALGAMPTTMRALLETVQRPEVAAIAAGVAIAMHFSVWRRTIHR